MQSITAAASGTHQLCVVLIGFSDNTNRSAGLTSKFLNRLLDLADDVLR